MTKPNHSFYSTIMNDEPTERQDRVLQYLINFKKQNGYFPSLDEMGDALLLSKTGVSNHIKSLEAKGILHKVPGVSRAYIIAPQKENK